MSRKATPAKKQTETRRVNWGKIRHNHQNIINTKYMEEEKKCLPHFYPFLMFPKTNINRKLTEK